MQLTQILASVASASLATSLPLNATSHSQSERRGLPTTLITTTSSTTTSTTTWRPYQGTAAAIAPASVDYGYCAPVGPQYYSGPAPNFPRMSEWKSFDELFNCNKPSMSAQGNTLQDNANVHDAILQVADGLGIDNRVILAIIMQESHGKVNTPNAADGQNTPGLMQAWGCPNHAGQAVVTRDEVFEMVQCGSEHFRGDGGATSDVDTIYVALRSYNSGPNGVNRNDLSNSASGTPSYVSDVANRLRGWAN